MSWNDAKGTGFGLEIGRGAGGGGWKGKGVLKGGQWMMKTTAEMRGRRKGGEDRGEGRGESWEGGGGGRRGEVEGREVGGEERRREEWRRLVSRGVADKLWDEEKGVGGVGGEEGGRGYEAGFNVDGDQREEVVLSLEEEEEELAERQRETLAWQRYRRYPARRAGSSRTRGSLSPLHHTINHKL